VHCRCDHLVGQDEHAQTFTTPRLLIF
jgi:hypothetical protein